MRKIGCALVFIIPILFLLASPAALACSNACSATTQYACSLVTSSMTKSSSGTLTVSLTNKQASSSTETATITGSWFSASTGSVSSTFSQNVPASVSFTVTPNDAGSKSVCVNMETTGCQADCGSITIDSPASLSISSLSSSASSVAASSSFTVTGTVQNSGTATAGTTSSVTATLSADTCTVASGSQTVGQLAGSSSWSNTWTVTMGSSTCVLTLSASGTNGGSASSSITVTKKAATTAAAAASSSSSSVASDALPLASNIGAVETIVLSGLNAGDNTLKISKSDISWTQIVLNMREAIDDQVEIKVQSLKEKPVATTDPGELVYQYLFTQETNVPLSKVLNVKIRFKIPNTWLESNDLTSADIVLKRYSEGEWTDLPTVKISSDSINNIFEADSPYFSYFAVGAKQGAAVEKEEAKQQAIQEAEKLAEEEKQKELEEAIREKSRLFLVLGIAAVVLLLAGLLAFVAYHKKR